MQHIHTFYAGDTQSALCLTDELTGAPPAGEKLTVRSEVGRSWFLRVMCFGLTVIVSAFVYVGAQRCRAHVEPYSHSSNTHIFKNLSLIPVYCLWTNDGPAT